ncbi:MAG: flagellar biosynthesis protein FlhF [Myxococcota bacterium]
MPDPTPRTFRASRMDLAMRAIKRELGDSAVILGTRQTRDATGARMVEVMAGPATSAPSFARAHQGERVLERRLERMGVPSRDAASFVARMRTEIGRVPPTLERARPALETVLGQQLVFAGPARGEPEGPRVVALVGPTGVGKTTTIAKIAANAALVEAREVGLVSIDGYRVGGAEQLQRYADLMGVRMEVAEDARSLRRALTRLADKDLVLLDTAGRSPSDHGALEETASWILGAGEPAEIHLCVSAATSDVELRAIIERHRCLDPARLLVTKLDEAVYHGSIVAAQALSELPFSYFTTGQRVPEDIEVAKPARLAGLLCGEEVEA